MRLLRWTLPVVACLLCVAPAHAIPITYTVAGTATGALGASAFTNALVTVALVGDTSFVGLNSGSATVTVAGVGTAVFTDTIAVTDNPSNPSAQIADVTLNRLIFGTNAPAFATYDLRGPIGPISGTALINAFAIFPTTLGNFDMASVSGNTSTFTATTASSVPEPASIVLLGIGLLAARARHGRTRRVNSSSPKALDALNDENVASRSRSIHSE
jgi:hypothetical protein